MQCIYTGANIVHEVGLNLETATTPQTTNADTNTDTSSFLAMNS